MNKSKLPVFLLSLLLLTTTLVDKSWSQAVYGSISGTVSDQGGAVVPGATVTIRSIERNTSDTVVSNDSGLFTKERLLPGNYEVKIEKEGFKQSVVSPVTVNVDASTETNVSMETGQVSETVIVSGTEGELLKTDRADVATTFTSRQVTDLPILDRNFTKLVLLTPGTVQQSWGHAASENPQGSTQTLVNGQTFSGTGYQLDGTDNRDPILGIIVINPNFEAIGETKVTSQNYDAEFGQAIAGVAAVQTKSGTNEFHGSIFDFRRSDVWQARNPYSQAGKDFLTGKFIPDTLKNQFGGAIGGPILKEKLFFFGDYQGTRSKIGGTRLLTVPTAKARTGDFSEYNVAIFDPAQTVVNSAGQVTSSTPFAGNVIPTSRLSPQALNVLKLIPLPNRPGNDNGTRDNFAASGSELFNNDTWDVRIDSRLSQSFNLFGRYSYAKYKLSGPTAFGQGGGRELVSLGGDSNVRNDSVAIGFDYTLSPTTVVDFRFGFFRYKVNVLPFDFGTSPAADAGIPGLNFDDFTSGLPSGEIQGDFGFRFGSGLDTNRCNCPLDQDEKQGQVVVNLSKLVGNHTLKFGVDVRRAHNLRVPSDAHRSGQLVFNTDRTGGLVTGSSGQTFRTGIGTATFLLGDVTSFQRFVSTSTDARERQWRHFYYGQDTWRATPKLTIAYGLRLDVINPQTLNEPGNGGFIDLDTGAVRVAGVGDNKLNGNVENSLNFAPRLGVTYQIGEKNVIRAGYGRSYDIGVFGSVFGHTVTQNLPVLANQNLNAANNFSTVFNLAQGPPAFTNFFGLSAPPNQGGVPLTSLPANGIFYLPDGVAGRVLTGKQRLPTVDAYNVTFQRQVTKTATAEIAYVGNKGSHGFIGDGPAASVNQPTIVGFGTIPRNNRRPFFNKFGWSQDLDYFCNCADNRYNSLQAKFTKRFSDGYSVLTHYTLQRITNNSGELFFSDRDLNRGPNDFDRTHVFVLSQVAELPFGRGKRFFTNASRALDLVIGGFQFNSNTRVASGIPFNVGYDAGANIDVGPNRPDLVGDPETGGSRERYFNTAAFANPGVGRFGNLPRNALRGPGFWQTDASLFKKFAFLEDKVIEFRVEVANLFNTVNLGQPDTNIGNPSSPNASAGRINGTADNSVQRNFQFALKFSF